MPERRHWLVCDRRELSRRSLRPATEIVIRSYEVIDPSHSLWMTKHSLWKTKDIANH